MSYGITQCYLPPDRDENPASIPQPKQVLDLATPEGCKAELNVFIVSASGGQQPQFWANFGGSCVDPLLPMRVKSGVL